MNFESSDVELAVNALIANQYSGDVGELDVIDLQEIVWIVLSAVRQAPSETHLQKEEWL